MSKDQPPAKPAPLLEQLLASLPASAGAPPAYSVPLTANGAAEALAALRTRRPLVHNITNYVAMTIAANVLLALGASPAMVHAAEEVEDFLAISDALAINIGTLSPPWVEAMRLAAKKAVALGKPWVLDPVGCGATPYRTRVAAELVALKPSIVRGNASEIMALAGAAGAKPKGVDSAAPAEAAISAAWSLAGRTGAVVAVTGATDYATDGKTVVALDGGHALMPLSTAFGCALTATTAAFAAVVSPMSAAVAALAAFKAAGKEAGMRVAERGPGHLPAELIDALYRLNAKGLAQGATVRSASAQSAGA
ncbi:MAG: hydroxyethylthiazole kinase [Bauldia sp.]